MANEPHFKKYIGMLLNDRKFYNETYFTKVVGLHPPLTIINTQK